MFKNLSTIFSGFNSKQNQNAPDLIPKTRPSTPGHSTKDGRSSFQDTPYRASNTSLLNMSNPFEKAKEKGKSESTTAQNLDDQLQSTENLLDRSVKITFPKNNDSDVISEAILRERVGQFGEVVNVGMKEKLAVVLYATSKQALVFCVFHDNILGNNYKVKYMGTKSLRDEELQEQLQQHQLQQKPAPLPLASTPLQSTPMRRPPPPPTAESPHTEQIQAESPLSKLAIPGLASEGKKSDREWRPSEKSYTLNRSRTRSGDSETETDNDFDFEGGRGASQRGQGGFRAPVVVTTNASHPSPVSADLSLRSFADRSDFLDMEKSQGVASSSQMGSNQNRLREGYETKQSPSLRAVEPKGFNRLDESTIDEYDGDGGQGWAGITSGGRENPSPSQRSVITMDTAPGARSTRSQQDGRAAEPLRAQDELMEADNRMPVVRDSWKSAKTISSLKPTTYDNKIYENKQASKDWQSDNFDTNANESYSRGLMETVSESGSDEKGNVLQVRKISYASQSDSISKSSRGNISMNTETLVTACSEKVDTASSNSIPATARGFTSSNGPVVLPRANANICDTSDVGFGFGSELDVQSAGLGLAKSDRRLKNSSTSSGNKNITDSKFDDDVRAQRTDRYSPLFVTDEKVDGPVSNEKSRSMNSRNYNISSDNQTRTDSSSDSELYQNGSSPTTSQGFHQSKLPDRVGKSIRSSTLVSMDREVSIEELERKSARCSPEKCRNCMKNLCSSNSFSNQDCGHHAIMTAPVLMQSTSRRSSPSRLTHRRRRADERSSPTDMVLVGSSSLPLAAKDFEMQVALLKKKILLLETESKAHQMERDTLRSEFKRNEDLWVAELSLLTRRNLILEEESKQLKEDMQNFKIQNTIKDAKMSVLEGSSEDMRAQLAKSKRMVESEVSAVADITKEREEGSHIDCSPESNLEEINVDAPTRNQPSQTSQVLNVKQEEGKAEVKMDTSPDCRVSQPVPPIPSLVIISVGAPTVVSKTEYPLHSTISLLEDLRSTRRELDKHSQLTFQPSSSSSNRHNGIRFDDRRSNAQGDASKRYGREMSVDSTTLYSIARGDYFNTKVHSEPIVVPQRAYSDTYRSSLSYTPEPSHNKLGGHPSLPVPHVNPSTLPPSMSYYSHLLRPSHFSAPLPLGNNLQSEKAGRRREYLARLHEVQ